MLNMMKMYYKTPYQQRGAAAVEFAIIAIFLFILLFGIIEFGRLFYVFNTVQEVTRRAAREAVVSCSESGIKTQALFGGTSLPAGAEITTNNIEIKYLNKLGGPASPPSCPGGNLPACLLDANACVAFVQVSIINDAYYEPMVGLFKGVKVTIFPFSEINPFKVNLRVQIPPSTVTMPAESMAWNRS